jgi:hypothetical protein
VTRIAPNLNTYVFRPILADPPLCSLSDIKTVLTLDDLADLHEALDLKDAIAAKAAEKAERDRRR